MTDSNPAIRTIPEDSNPTQDYPKAVAARIGNRELWLGNSGAIEPDNMATMGLDPEYVVSVNKRTTTATTDHHPLVDARINDPDQFATAVETARERYRQSGTLLVNCAAGISRSTAVVATVLAVEEEMLFEEAVSEIRDTRQLAKPHRKLQINAYSYLIAEHGRATARNELGSLVESAYVGGEDDETALEPLEEGYNTDEDGLSVDEQIWKRD